MVTRSAIGTYGLMDSIVSSTSTGPGTSFPVATADNVAMSVTRASTAATGTQVQVQGSLDGTNWFTLGATQTYTSTGTSVYNSTGLYLATEIRANVVIHAATDVISVSLAVK